MEHEDEAKREDSVECFNKKRIVREADPDLFFDTEMKEFLKKRKSLLNDVHDRKSSQIN